MQKLSAFKVLLAHEVADLQRDGSFAGTPADIAAGYIHLSTADQLDRTIKKHFEDRYDAHIVAIDIASLADHIRWEVASNGQLYPHLYTELKASAVLAYMPVRRRHDGTLDVEFAA